MERKKNLTAKKEKIHVGFNACNTNVKHQSKQDGKLVISTQHNRQRYTQMITSDWEKNHIEEVTSADEQNNKLTEYIV